MEYDIESKQHRPASVYQLLRPLHRLSGRLLLCMATQTQAQAVGNATGECGEIVVHQRPQSF